MSVAFVAMAFVVGVRLCWITFIHAIAYPVAVLSSRLPETFGPTFPRLARLRRLLYSAASDRVPEWIEPFGDRSWMYKVGTDRGMAHLDVVVESIPDSVMSHWRRFGVTAMGLFVVFWGAVLLGALGLALWSLWRLVIGIGEWAIAYDWLALLEIRAPSYPEFDLMAVVTAAVEAVPQVAMALGLLAVTLAVTIVLFWIIMLPFLPGLILHEFGHYAAVRKAGASVDSYGLLLIGPVLGGAYVEPGSDAGQLGRQETFGVWAGGIANSLIWGSILIVAGAVLSGEPLPIIEAFLFGNGLALTNTPVASILLVVGVVEIGNAFVNTVPLGPVDGGGFIRSVEREWWGFHRALGEGGSYP